VVQDARVSAEPRDAVERVWLEQGPKLWRSLVAFTGDRELATDSMAEAFAQALAPRDRDPRPRSVDLAGIVPHRRRRAQGSSILRSRSAG
jgi:DNA-directed RNA polymerase specialized sigma24 family protein